MSSLFRKVLCWPPIALFPVRVRSGLAEGAKWTLFPWSAYWRGTHEPEVQRRVIALRKDWTGLSVWDLGGHYGIFSIGLGMRVGPTGSVAAFEPNPRTYARLKLHISRNQLHHVSAFNCAVSDAAGTNDLLFYEGAETTSSHLPYEGETAASAPKVLTVQTVRLDDSVACEKLRAPDFIKVDVEGHGHKALAGAADTIARFRPIILMGFHSEQELAGAMSVIEPLRYRITDIGGNSAVPRVGEDFIFEPLL